MCSLQKCTSISCYEALQEGGEKASQPGEHDSFFYQWFFCTWCYATHSEPHSVAPIAAAVVDVFLRSIVFCAQYNGYLVNCFHELASCVQQLMIVLYLL